MGNVHRRGNDDSDGRRMKRKPEGSMTFESGMLGNLGDNRDCRESVAADAAAKYIWGMQNKRRGSGSGKDMVRSADQSYIVGFADPLALT